MTAIIALSLITWTIIGTLALTADTEDRKGAVAALFLFNIIAHAAFQFGSAWQRADFESKAPPPVTQTP